MREEENLETCRQGEKVSVRRKVKLVCAVAVALLSTAGIAQAAAPTLGPVTATNLQGVSALLEGTVDPQGLPTAYRFEYVDQASFTASGFAGATSTPSSPVGSGDGDRLARAAISGLAPSTSYSFRLVASNPSGTTTGAPAAFTTTQGFGFLPGTEGFAVSALADGGQPASQAGLHPYQLSLAVGLRQGGEFEDQPGVPFPDGDLRDLRVETPSGLIANPAALPKCGLIDFLTRRSSPFEASRSGESCQAETQVGTVDVYSSIAGGQPLRFGVFNLAPAPGVPAQLGFSPFGAPIVLDSNLRPRADGSYVQTLEAGNIPQSLDLRRLELVLWGTPWAVSHNPERGNCLNEREPSFPWAKCQVGDPATSVPRAYLTLPTVCSGPLSFAVSARSWQQGVEVSAQAVNRDEAGQPVDVGSCGDLFFDPAPVGQLTDVKASSPTGYNFQLSSDQRGLTEPSRRAPVPARTAVVTLPEGVTVNPSVGTGLAGCTPQGYAAETAFSPPGGGCPNASRIGDFSVSSPLFDERLDGEIYLATPDNRATSAAGAENPFDSLIAVYLVAKLPQRGVLIKVAGRIVPDPTTGHLTAIFDGLPQIPYTGLNLTFRGGQRAFMVTPAECGPATTRIDLSPWASSLAGTRTETASAILTGVSGGPCPPLGPPPFAPGAVAGGVNSNVNSYTPYFVHLSRQDTEQEITSYSLVLPEGITGKLAGIPFCPDAAISAARVRPGFDEARSPSCSAASQVGRTSSGYGVGSSLTYAEGAIYLAGPYNGAPLSLVTINPATVGPFDLGTVVIRSALQVDPLTAQLRIDSRASDPIPHILQGIPLHLRDIRIYMDRPEFTHNPSSCAPSQLVSTLTGSAARLGDSSDDSTAVVTKRFQLLNCLTLGFKPKLGVRLRGGTRRGAYPELRANFAARGPRDSNLKEIAVDMPHSLFLAQNHIRQICTRVQFAADRCPAGSVSGSAAAHTPLFDTPLRGPVVLRSSSNKLPDLVASLHSGEVRIVLEGEIGPTKRGGIRVLFANLPDEPLDRFVMTMKGGRGGLLVNSANICVAPPVASVKALGQNNRGRTFTTKLRGQCKKKQMEKKKSKKRGGR